MARDKSPKAKKGLSGRKRAPAEGDHGVSATAGVGARDRIEEEASGVEVPAGKTYPIVGIGASAGGFEAFRELLGALPNDTGMAFVLVQHLDPGHESMLTRLLSKATSMPVTEVRDGMGMEPNHVYVIPPNTTMAIRDGVLRLLARGEPGAKHMPIDHFLRSLADEQGSMAIGVILSGTASDGTQGLKAIKAEGGITFAQDEKSARYDGMPRSAAAAGCVDFVMPPEGIAKELGRIGQHPFLALPPAATAPSGPPEGGDEMRRVLVLVRNATGVDFTYYKPATIKRRIARRLVLHKIDTLKQYLKYLHDNREEIEALYQDFLIHVTGFFREPDAFRVLKDDVFPKMLAHKPPREPIRLWVPGCSTGEELYSLVFVLLEYLGDRASSTPVQAFGTDISDAAIDRARAGVYQESSVADVPAELMRRPFLAKTDGGYRVNKTVREMCVFARQDLGRDPPFSRLDLISCRNVLIYMGSILQKKIMQSFHYALKPTGFLLLGKSESISGFADLFTIVDRKAKIYSKTSTSPQPHLEFAAGDYEKLLAESPAAVLPRAAFDVLKEADRITLNRYAPAGFLINEHLQIVQFRGQTGPYLEPLAGDASLGLLKMVRAELVLELRTAIHKAKKQHKPVRKEGLSLRRDGRQVQVSLEVVPIADPQAPERHFLVLFQESSIRSKAASTTRTPKSQPAAPQAWEVPKLKQELQATRDYLQAIIEEQEATNEELKSANEEILSSNEELQSTNEELETAKEELQSANEELVTVNETLQNRNAELAQLSDDLSNLLSAVNIPIVMLSNDRRIRRFTPMAEKLLNLLPGDIGRPIGNIKPNFDVPNLQQLITEVMETISVREQEVRDLDGRWYSMRVRPYRTVENKIDGVVMVFIDIDISKRSQDELREERDFVSAVLDTIGAPVAVLDRDGRFMRFNRACQELSGLTSGEALCRYPWDLVATPAEAKASKSLFYQPRQPGSVTHHENYWTVKNGRRRLIAWSSSPLFDAQGSLKCVILAGIDITERREAEEALRLGDMTIRRSQEQLRALAAGLLTAQEEERKLVSRELHDDLNQQLAMLTVEVEALERQTPSGRDLRKRLASLRKRAGKLSEHVGRTAYQLHPSAIEHLGLVPALKQFCGDFAEQEGIRVKMTHRNMPDLVPPDVALCFYRVTQEALRNVAKHAESKRARVNLTGKDGTLRLSISDSGVGFDPQSTRNNGLGLISMEERARLVGGTFGIDAEPGRGATVEVLIPRPQQPPPRNRKRS